MVAHTRTPKTHGHSARVKKHSVFKYANGQATNEMVNISIIRDVKLIETLIS